MPTGVRGIDAIGDTGDAAASAGDRTLIQIAKQISANTTPGGGGGAVTIADGADVAQGTTTDVANTSTVIGLLKKIRDVLLGGVAVSWAAAQHVITDATSVTNATLSAETTKVIGTVNVAAAQAIQANAGTNLNTSALALEAGHLAAIDTSTAKIPAQGQALASASTPVVLPAAQVTTLTPPAAITGFNLEATQALVKAKTDNLDVALSTRLKPADTLTAVTTVGTITNVVHVDDNAASLTVDAPVGTPVFARLSDGAAALIGQKAMASSIPVTIASDQSATIVDGDVDHDAVNTLNALQISGHASSVDNPPTAVSAVGDRVRFWADRFGAQVIRQRQIRETYTAVFRLAEAAARLDQTFTQVANTNKQWATLHHAATATKELKLVKCWAYITSDTVAGIQGVIELRELSVTTPPATGNPAITGRAHRIGTGAHEATALYLPTTQGSEAAANSPLGHVPFDTGISGAVSTSNPVPVLVPVVLYDQNTEDASVMPLTAPVGVYGGWAVMIRTVGVPVLRVTIHMKFTEEIP